MTNAFTLENLVRKIDKAVDDLSEIITGFAHQVDARFNGVEKRLDEQDKKFDRLFSIL